MPDFFSTEAIMLRRTAYGDYDLILTFFSEERGKVAVMAKSARKHTRRFSPVLFEPLSVLHIVCHTGRGRLPVLQEATLTQPQSKTRTDIQKMAYAGYWSELLNGWLEENAPRERLYTLFREVLSATDRLPPGLLSLFFQMKLMALSGLVPDLSCCVQCRTAPDAISDALFFPDPARGGVRCARCAGPDQRPCLSRGTLRQLQWMTCQDLQRAGRIRLTPRSLEEGLAFAEAFVPYHLGKTPQSLRVLHQIRRRP
ncbi:DNA repair protein RecO [Desulfonema ishimotonii]|uniref:DNA repair protein RecO n=2 Tax=Desulfonema ishimotonii TaxID=45657 RepID=A0A401G4E8_9BACT|nr:DNA repair protein RecO [Desulfonema ishimotonii]